MYLIVIHVPVYLEGNNKFLTTEWKRSLFLLRDSLKGRFGPITVLSPGIQNGVGAELILEPISDSDGINIIPSIDPRLRARNYWFSGARKEWKRQVKKYVSQAQIVHTGLDQLWKPIMYEGFLEALKQQKITVFVTDTDVISQMDALSKNSPWETKFKSKAYCFFLEHVMRWSLKRADLSLLKGKKLKERYEDYAKNPKYFQDTSYVTNDVIQEDELKQRLEKLSTKESFNLVYSGRFEKRKGLKKSFELIHSAVEKNPNIYLDIIGGGPEKEDLENYVKRLNMTSFVRFLGTMTYDQNFLKKLSEYDAMLFTPLAEDTPRMIFDGFAAGLPLLCSPIPYAEELIEDSQAGQIVRTSNDLIQLAANKQQLSKMSFLARQEALKNGADTWYRKRAEWTIEAYEKNNR